VSPRESLVTATVSEELHHMMWIHGTSLHVERPDQLTRLTRRGSGTSIEGAADESNWVHFAIPTTSFASGRRLRIRRVALDFETGNQAVVDQVHVYHGPSKIASHAEELSGDQHFALFDVEDHQPVTLPIGISVRVRFLAQVNGNGRFVDFRGAGAEFISRTDVSQLYVP
jgi:hypothetical protein